MAIATATAAAYRQPATSYELSTYTATPILFWICVSAALLISIVVIYSFSGSRDRMLGATLSGLSMTAIVSLPVMRGYHYLGEGDALSHLGTARDMNASFMDVTDNRYPAIHTLGSIFSDATGLELYHSFMILVVVFTLCFFIFIPLTVRELTSDSRLAYIGIYSGFLLLPINHLSAAPFIHPTSQALMYAPVVVFLFIAVYRKSMWKYSFLFLLVSTMLVFLHLQQAANFVLFFGTIATLQLGRFVLTNKQTVTSGHLVYPLAGAFALVFWLWVQDIETFWTSVVETILVPFTESQTAESTATRSVSLEQVGGSLLEVFLKLFLVPLIFSIFSGILMLGVALRSTGLSVAHSMQQVFTADVKTERVLLLYFIGGFITVSGLFIAYLVGGISDQYFRHFSFLMVLVTILGSITLGRAMLSLGHRWSSLTARWTLSAVVVVFLILTIPVVFSSPYFYYTSNHVTQAQMNGYETTFINQEDSIPFDDVRSDTSRYGNAIQGRDIPREDYYRENEPRGGIPDHFAEQSLREYYEQRMYVPITDADRIRDPILWDGFRFSHDDFRYLDNEPGINKVQSNGGYDLYFIEPDNNDT
ncbi:hypothetical protein HUB97_13650 [Halorubraceae archaeon YAN]|nr:hypothetical protein [Halorubraceae archaeon YAN]